MPDSSQIDTVVVDVDGTLVDSNYHHAMAWAQAFAGFDLHPPVWQIHRSIGMGGDRLVGAVAGDDVEDEHGDAIREAWKKAFEPLLDQVPALPGAQDFLQFLRNRGLSVVLATSGNPDHIAHYLDMFDGRELSEAQVSTEEVESSKPAPDVVDKALREVDAVSAVMVGDTVWDVRAAAEVNVPTLCVRTGGFGVDELAAAGARAVVEDLPALQEQWDDLIEGPPAR